MHTDHPGQPEASDRGRYRPPIGIPEPVVSRRWPSTLLSFAFHALIVLLIVAPFAAPMVLREVEGAGGPGPAGGGGGGTGGTGGLTQERLRYLQVAPPAPAPKAPSTQPQLVVPVPPPPPPKPEPKPEPVPVPPPVAPPQAAAPAPAAPAATVAAAATPGEGGGTGMDGTAGSGPGSGGGVGSGVGTGRGSAVGPGTGGGNATVFPPQAIEVFIPPLPVPGKVKGTELVVVFDVDSTGRVLTFDFAPTRDGGYNRKLREVLSAVRFRPATLADGTPVRAKGSLAYVF